jgi:hypothetical protein
MAPKTQVRAAEGHPSTPKAKPSSTPANTPAPKAEDQKAGPAGDQKDVKAKAKKKLSPTVLEWRRLIKEKACASGTISVSPEAKAKNPKRGKAASRFNLYKDGMTVEQYIEASHKAGNAKALAQSDIRWDVASGFISIK